jgi:uncharacterized membrane protein
MATLTAWRLDEPGKAEEAARVLEDLQKKELIHVIDATWVTWPDTRGPKTHPLHQITAIGAAGGGFRFLFGLIFFVPLLGLTLGAAAGAAAGRLADVGINDAFIAEVREKVTPGTSALFAHRECRLRTGSQRPSRGSMPSSSPATCRPDRSSICARHSSLSPTGTG